MEKVKETKEYTIYKKENGRYAVQNPKHKFINGNEKVKILVGEGLIKTKVLTKEAPVVEAPAEEKAE